MVAETGVSLLDDDARRKLAGLSLNAPHVRVGAMKGERRSSKRGTSIEFADTRDYTPGDDLRRLDWNALARLDRPLIRLYEDEEDLAVHILLDCSASMEGTTSEEFPTSGTDKFTYAQRLTAALAYLALMENDRLLIAALRGGTSAERLGPARGRAYLPRLFQYLAALKPGGQTDLNAALRDYAYTARPGLVLLISDGFSPGGYTDGLNALGGRGCETVFLHLLSPDECEPPLSGDLRLIDRETGAAQEISLDSGLRDLYIRRVADWRASVRAECERRRVHYVPIRSDAPWETVVLNGLRRVGIIR